ncbi:MAG: hypothetical protein JAY71_17735 [Candidatus Thiodiazotropha weberae]|nr:hypothetical protein [Candidatus Thiodiazotropha weberae]
MTGKDMSRHHLVLVVIIPAPVVMVVLMRVCLFYWFGLGGIAVIRIERLCGRCILMAVVMPTVRIVIVA